MTAPLSDARMVGIRARAEAATDGPWGVSDEVPTFVVTCLDGEGTITDYLDEADAEFIAHARTDVPALLAEVDRQAAEIDRLRKAVKGERVRAEARRDALEEAVGELRRWAAKNQAISTGDEAHDRAFDNGYLAALGTLQRFAREVTP